MTTIIPRLIPGCTEPAFQRNADSIALQMAKFSPEDLARLLKCSEAIAKENRARFRRFIDPSTRRPAVFCYDGTVYRNIDPATMDDAMLQYANGRLVIASYMYGVLRPLDLINPYRLEGNVKLAALGGKSLSDYWKPIATEWLINSVKADDGVLLDLASKEFRRMFDWERVGAELKVVSPTFLVGKGSEAKEVTVYSKKFRGQMTAWVLNNHIDSVASLEKFNGSGIEYAGDWKYLFDND